MELPSRHSVRATRRSDWPQRRPCSRRLPPAVVAAAGPRQPPGSESASAVPTAQTAAPAGGDAVERGRYLVTVAGCNDCHAPFKLGPQGSELDMTRMLSGHPERMVLEPPIPAEGSLWIWRRDQHRVRRALGRQLRPPT